MVNRTTKYSLFIVSLLAFFLLILFTFNTPWVKQLDFNVLHTIEGWRTDTLTSIIIFITTVGSWYVTAPIWFAVMVFLLYKRKGLLALYMTLVFWGVRALNWGLKEIFARPRPDWSQVVPASHYSFPSGHAMNSMAFYSGLLLLIWMYTRSRAIKTAATCVIAILILLIGFSRLYLGVHFLTDILAGYCLGLAWSLGIYLLSKRIYKKK
ncbi:MULTISPECIES: phosphatase PAP2 family protein [Priestia]|jgi:undecaprenyl-diphosphatase|uniref:phosphatase PAP2 family protein n=1 Tax=Priestia TaxID=2800373 RepID=UPI0020409978|nr:MULTISPECIES: phosphatase PAP2 family protein [Priestia]MCM3769272.1 phosphatase PAP2 family protein [Priestia aryabhattai]MDY0938685.1 phosphatase PAP2 family protein [Priestia megaterium]